jgi:hypothetical protein
MKHSIVVFFLILLGNNNFFCQDYYQYNNSTAYARGIACKNDTFCTVNSDGVAYQFKWDSSINQPLNTIPFEELRDLVIDDSISFFMQSGSKGVLLKMIGSRIDTIQQLYQMATNVFFDGMDKFKNALFIMGDPIDGYFSLYRSLNNGLTWSACPGKIKAYDGEAGFAASGTTVQLLSDSVFIFVSGGLISRFFKSVDQGKTWSISTLPFKQNSPAAGAFSIHMKSPRYGITVGGNYEQPNDTTLNCFITNDGGLTWRSSLKNPNGYRSCVIEKNGVWYCCGTSGIDFSLDEGVHWSALSDKTSFALTTDSNYLYATGKNAHVYRFKLLSK